MAWRFPRRAWLGAPAGVAVALASLAPAVRADVPDLLAVCQSAQAADPTIRSARFALDIARQKLPEARAALLPVAALTSDASVTSANTAFSGSPTIARGQSTSNWTLQVSQPIFNAGAVFAHQEASWLVDSAESQYLQAQQDLLMRVAQAWNAVKGNTAGYRLGIRTGIDVLNSQQQLYAAQRDLSKARYEVLLQGMKLKAAAGALVDDDIRIVNALLQR